MGSSRLYEEDRWPRHLGNSNSKASAEISSKKYRYNSLSREWRINMDNKTFMLTSSLFGKTPVPVYSCGVEALLVARAL